LELTISLPGGAQRVTVAGAGERNLKIIRDALGVALAARDGSLRIRGSKRAVGQASRVIERLTTAARRNQPMTHQEVLDTIADTGSFVPDVDAHDVDSNKDAAAQDTLDVYLPGRRIRPMTDGQRHYLRTLHEHDLTFCIGPAGTGKTYLAVGAAVQMLKHGKARKLVLVRPAVEAGEKLGFLPGDMQQKVNPYLRPLLDALHDMMQFDQIQRFMAADLIEIVPLAFMRGRTLNDAVVILDEAQNTTRQQMLMFLTRLGHEAKMIVTGDTSQTDLDDPCVSGLVDAARRLRRIAGIAFVTLDRGDIVRHRLVQRIVQAYGREPSDRNSREQIDLEPRVEQRSHNIDRGADAEGEQDNMAPP